jgi:hypothetical protein
MRNAHFAVIARLDRMGAKIVEASLPFVDVFFVEVR